MKECILFFSANIGKWGAERSTCSLCDNLQKIGFKVVVVIPRYGEIIDLFKEYDLDYITVPFPSCVTGSLNGRTFRNILRYLYYDIWQRRKIVKLLNAREYKPILVYSNTILFTMGIKIALSYHVPHVQHIRENTDAFHYKFLLGKQRALRYVDKHSRQVLCTCDAIKNVYLQYFDKDKLKTVHNGVIPMKIDIKNVNYNGHLEILQVARFMNDKRIIDSLKAIKILKDKGICNFHLDLYGAGEEEELYKKYITENGLQDLVSIMGFCSSIPFRKYHVGLMTSTFEAFSRTNLDYMNNGLCIIASNTGGNTEQVIDKKTGVLFEVKNPDSLADAISGILDTPSLINKYGQNGREHFKKHFTQDRYVQKASQIIISSLNKDEKH